MSGENVQHWMTKDPITIAPLATPDEAASLMARHDIRHLPVVDDGLCVGVLSLDALRHARMLSEFGNIGRERRVADLMRRDTSIDAAEGMGKAAERMLLLRATALAVVDNLGQLLGILTQSDMLYHTLLRANPPPAPYSMTLRGGETVSVRPIHPHDAPALRRLYDELSANSRYYRFFQTNNPFNARNIRRFTIADYREHMAYVVENPTGAGLIGVAEYVPIVPPQAGSAEFSIAIADAWQGNGLGKRLLRDLIDYGRDHGIQRLLGVIHQDNKPMLRLIDSFGLATERSLDGAAYDVWILLNQAPT